VELLLLYKVSFSRKDYKTLYYFLFLNIIQLSVT